MFETETTDPNIIPVILKEIEGLTAFIENVQTREICKIPVKYIPDDSQIGDRLYLKISKTPVSEDEQEAIARKLLEKFVNVGVA